MNREYFEDCPIGDRVVTPGRTITETDVVMFAAFSGDWNAIHTDAHWSAQHSPFGQRIAHGLLGLVVGTCLLSRVGWFHFWPQSLVCASGMENVRFVRPILIGDTIHLEAQILEKKDMPDGRNGLITTRMSVRNQRNEMVLSGRMTIVAGKRVAMAAATPGKES